MRIFFLILLFLSSPAGAQSLILGGPGLANALHTCTVSPCDPPALTWTQIVDQNGVAATRQPLHPGVVPYGTQHDTGVYPYGINGFSWELSGWEFLGDFNLPANVSCQAQKHFDCTAMTAWHIVYPEAATIHGSAKPGAAGVHVIYRGYQSWCHFVSGGWFLAQDPTTISNGVVTNELTSTQSAVVRAQVVTDLGGGNYSMFGPAIGNANHGWINSRGSYSINTVDHCYMQYQVRVDQPNANLLASTGIDWWRLAGGGFGAPIDNYEYSHGTWIRITQDWQWQTGSSMDLTALQADPPPPLIGIGP